MALSTEHIITLQNIRGFGAGTVQRICDEAVSSGIRDISSRELSEFVDGLIGDRRVRRVAAPDPEEFDRACESARRILSRSEAMGIGVVTRYDRDFPAMLLTTVDGATGRPAVPVVMYYRGNLAVSERPALAVIGTREPTVAGLAAGRYYAEAFASIGVNIVSGLALGCDTAGHLGALDAGGVTTCFLAHGLDTVYPKENERLAADIVAAGGLIMSEYPVGAGVNRYGLVARDRLQAGMSNATLVVQTGVRGGTMHAVEATLKAGKPLLAVSYRDDQGEKGSGNAYLVERRGAQPLRATRQDIVGNADAYRTMLLGRPSSDAGVTSCEPPVGTLF